MATRKKTPARKKPAHNDTSSDHGDRVIVTVSIGKLEYIKKRKTSKKATPKQAKAFLKWALAQL